MERALSIDEFVADPVGRFWLGPTHLVWCYSAGLCGAVNWGRPGEKDVRELIAAWQFTLRPQLASGFTVIMDNRALEHADWRTLSMVLDGIREIVPHWRRLVRRQAILIPPGVVGVMLAGLAPLVGILYPLRLFQELGEATAWLDHPNAATAVSEIEPLLDAARGTPPFLRALRDHLDSALCSVSVDAAARALGKSRRSLQRELRRAKTSFSDELDRARVRAALDLLAHTDDKVEVIALRIGCRSVPSLRAIFHRCVGETPVEYRLRMRRGVT